MRRRIALLSKPKREGYDAAVARLKSCVDHIDEYLRTHDADRRLELRQMIDRFVPGGVYIPGTGSEADAFVVFGVRLRADRSSREQAFYVAYAPLSDIATGELEGTWPQIPLVETDGFLCPVVRDDYRGERFVRIGEFRD